MDSKIEKHPIVNGTDEEQWIGNPPAYPTDNIELKTVLPCATSSSGYMHPDPPMREIYRSIFTLACCFWPFGIIAMLKALKGLKAHYNGDKRVASAYNCSALKWNVAAIVIGSILLNGIIQVIVRGSIALAHHTTMEGPDCINATLAAI